MDARARTLPLFSSSLSLFVLRPLRAGDNGISPCTISSDPTSLPGIAEASGLTLSRKVGNLLWSHNDSGEAVVFGVDRSGVRARVRIPKASVTDWEDISAAIAPSGDCLYIADIGDNKRSRRTVTIYRVAEPDPDATHTSAPDVFTAAYPDGPHDAEALFVIDAGLFIVTKDDAGTLYRLPQPLNGNGTATLQRVGTLGTSARDGCGRVAGRPPRRGADDTTSSCFTGLKTLTSGKPDPRGDTESLRTLREPQGEGVALGSDGEVYLASEGTGVQAD